ncbi:glycosyltransferase family protein [Arthrobacter flavus]|uniref:Glycosyltransferase n=1 Tax=Arthrobacter flavus TaxID=95172 RepID=A0ABW4QAT0_9MICC
MTQYREFAFRARQNSWSSKTKENAGRRIAGAIPLLRRSSFPEVELAEATPSKPEIRVGTILDAFSHAGFEWEWSCIPLRPGISVDALADLNLDFILIESAWHGNKGDWKYKLQGSAGPGEQVRALIDIAKAQGLPIVFWNKEDPPHYEDFLPLARLCDLVFTSDSNMIPRYRADLGHDRVEALAFAAQPKIHNPVRQRRGWHDRDVAFAGMFFSHKYPERREQMAMLLPAAVSACEADHKKFDIFSRAAASPEYKFPGELQRHVLGELNYLQMIAAYKRYKIFLNVNSVVDSPTMCSRRVFEMTAAGASVVTTPSPAINTFFSDSEMAIVANAGDASSVIRALLRNPSFAARQIHRGQREIWRHHTYRHRARQITEAVGIALGDDINPIVSVIVSSIRPDQLDHVLAGVAAQRDVKIQLVYGLHGLPLDEEAFRAKCRFFELEDVVAVELPKELSLGECLNVLVEKSNGSFVAKWDDDDIYAPWYLHDQLMALDFSGASVVGKRAHFMRLVGMDLTVLRNEAFEHRFTHFVAGPTLVGRREVFRLNPFPPTTTGEDTGFLRSVLDGGGSVYAADKFNYCQVRQENPEEHTWKITANEILATSEVAFYGDSVEQVFV